MKLRVYAGVGMALLLAAAVWPAAGKWDYSEIQNVPEKQKVKANPMEKDPEAAMAGKILFEDHCEECHGVKGEGKKKAPSLQAKEVQEATPGAIFWILTNGVVRKKMPVWSKLPEQQRWQLVSYIKSLGLSEAKK
jgi:mono/diheme cytochrome c family protein